MNTAAPGSSRPARSPAWLVHGESRYGPAILPTSLTVSHAAAPGPALTTILVVFVIGAVVILPSLGLLYILDQKNLAGEDLT